MSVPVHASLAGGRVPRESFAGLPPEAAFTVAEYEERIAQVRAGLRARQLDVLLLKHPPNIFYLSGFQSLAMYEDGCLVLPLKGEPALVLHPPELGSSMLHSWFDALYGYPPAQSHAQYLAELLTEQGHGGGRVGLEMLSPAVSAGFAHELEAALPQSTVVDASGVLEAVKRTKSAAEIEHLRRAARVTDASVQAAIEAARVGTTDNDMAAAAAQAMASAGGETPCMAPIVTSGRRSGILHTTYKRTRLELGDPVLIEIGGCYQRYTSPQMRTVSLGEPSADVRRAADACLLALNNVLETLRPGATANEVAKAGWDGIAQAGTDFVFHGNFGYAVGAGFPPSWADGTALLERGHSTVLEAGMVFHHPVAIRRLGQFAVGFSETTVLTDTGCEVLTSTPRELAIR